MTKKRSADSSPPSPSPDVLRPPSAKRQCTVCPNPTLENFPCGFKIKEYQHVFCTATFSLSSTKNEPAHYMLKIESFSIPTENPTIKIESDVFEASGSKWRLELHPSGNKEEDGSNHISLYLIICDPEYASDGWKVLVDVKFFVYDHVRHNFVTFQDADGKRIRFHEKQNKWGFDKLLLLEDFKDSSKGYLLNDSCVFGAEVFAVPEYALKDRCLSMTKPLATMNSYSWTIDNFSAITTHCLNSEVFKVGKVKWVLALLPKGRGTGVVTNMLCSLRVHGARLYPDEWRVYAKFELRVKNQSGYDDVVKETDHWFCKSAADCGYLCFMPLNELCDTTKGFLLNDRLIIEAKISVIGIQKDFI